MLIMIKVNADISSKTKYIDSDIDIDLISQFMKQIKILTLISIFHLILRSMHAAVVGCLPQWVGLVMGKLINLYNI